MKKKIIILKLFLLILLILFPICLKAGGTKLYKSKTRDIFILVCNRLNDNKDIYIGNYSMNYESDICETKTN